MPLALKQFPLLLNGLHVALEESTDRQQSTARRTGYELAFGGAELLLRLRDLHQRTSIGSVGAKLIASVEHRLA